jgi:hypothetical protein
MVVCAQKLLREIGYVPVSDREGENFMNKTMLLAAAAAVALTAGNVSAAAYVRTPITGAAPISHDAKGGKALWNQNSDSNDGYIQSQNYTSGTYAVDDNQGADDFVVPKGKTWTVTEVDVSGTYLDGNGLPAASENVFFYMDNKGVPGSPVKKGRFTNVSGTDSNGDFAIPLGKMGVKLKAGRYWVSIVANCDYMAGCGAWAWDTRSPIIGDDAMWREPGLTTGCKAWGTLTTCLGDAGDFMFALKGKSKGK